MELRLVFPVRNLVEGLDRAPSIAERLYRIAGYFRGGKFSRMHDAVSFRGENFREWLTRS